LRVAVKPPSSISRPQETIDDQKKKKTVEVHGRHDPCICPRVVPVVEAMIAVTLVDRWLIQLGYSQYAQKTISTKNSIS